MVSTTTAQKRYYSGEICPQTGTYAQYSDRTGDYAGTAYDRKVDKVGAVSRGIRTRFCTRKVRATADVDKIDR